MHNLTVHLHGITVYYCTRGGSLSQTMPHYELHCYMKCMTSRWAVIQEFYVHFKSLACINQSKHMLKSERFAKRQRRRHWHQLNFFNHCQFHAKYRTIPLWILLKDYQSRKAGIPLWWLLTDLVSLPIFSLYATHLLQKLWQKILLTMLSSSMEWPNPLLVIGIPFSSVTYGKSFLKCQVPNFSSVQHTTHRRIDKQRSSIDALSNI